MLQKSGYGGKSQCLWANSTIQRSKLPSAVQCEETTQVGVKDLGANRYAYDFKVYNGKCDNVLADDEEDCGGASRNVVI